MSHPVFPWHGHFEISIEGKMLIIHAEGPGNIELIQKYRRDVEHYRQQLDGQKWGNLVVFHGDSLITHESIEIMKDSIMDAKQYGMSAVAIQLDDASYTRMATQLWGSFYQQAELPHQFFTDGQLARKWLLEQLT